MSTLGQLRADVLAALRTVSIGTDCYVFDHVPEVMHAPALVIAPGSPYVTTEGEPFGHYRVNLSIIAVADVSTNEMVTAALDDLLGAAVVALQSNGFHVEEIGEPYAFQSNTALHLAADIAVSETTTF